MLWAPETPYAKSTIISPQHRLTLAKIEQTIPSALEIKDEDFETKVRQKSAAIEAVILGLQYKLSKTPDNTKIQSLSQLHVQLSRLATTPNPTSEILDRLEDLMVEVDRYQVVTKDVTENIEMLEHCALVLR